MKHRVSKVVKNCMRLKNKLHQQHIADGSSGNGEKHLLFPFMEKNNKGDGNQLRQSVASIKKTYIFLSSIVP